MKATRSAFSLIELIAVITVVTILTLIGAVLIQQARNQAFLTVSTSNLRQLQVANNIYAANNNGAFVAPRYNSSGEVKAWKNNMEFREYLGVADISETSTSQVMLSGYPIGNDRSIPSIGINGSAHDAWSPSARLRLDGIERPDRTISFADACDWWVFYANRKNWNSQQDGYLSSAIAYRFRQKCIAVAFDGSVFTFSEQESDEHLLWFAQ